jgi:hypothetical protein
MAKFLVEIYLDGEEEEEHDKACEDFLYDQLNMTASSVTITKIEEGE